MDQSEKDILYIENEDALVTAAYEGNINTVKHLLKIGKNIDAQDENGDTALMEAINEEWYHIALYLIKKGADVNICNNDGDSALDLAKYLHTPSDDLSINYSKLLLEKLKSINAKCKDGMSAKEKRDIEIREIMKEPQRPFILDLLFKDDRMFVLEISRVESQTLTSSEPPKRQWSVITRRNVSSYPQYRTGQFETRIEAIDYYKKIAVETPRVSFDNKTPNPIPSLPEYKKWLVEENLFDPILNPKPNDDAYPPHFTGRQFRLWRCVQVLRCGSVNEKDFAGEFIRYPIKKE
jgi:hypothetical protein